MAAPRRSRKNDVASRAYRDVFETESGRMVLADLRAFCLLHANLEIYHPDPTRLAANVGRTEVFQRIQMFLRMADEDIDRGERRAFQLVGGEE